MFLNRNMFPEINMVFYTPERHKLPSLCVKCMHHKFSALGTIIYLPSLKLMSILKGIPHQAKKGKKSATESIWYTVKILKIGTPEIITIIVLQLEQLDFTLQYCVQNMQTE